VLHCQALYGIWIEDIELNKRSGKRFLYCESFGKGDENTVTRNKSGFIICFSVLALALMANVCHGFGQKALEKLKETEDCTYCDLQNADLSGAQLHGARLSGSNLSGANLSKANLSDANMLSARMNRADISGANLSGAFLRSANFRDANLTGANLSRANLSGANLSFAAISGADLTDADLSGATWIDGTKCADESNGECKKEQHPVSGPGAFPF